MRITVFGTGYLGATHAACMAELGHEVLGVDVDPAKLAKLEAGEVPFWEPGLEEVLQRNIAAGRLRLQQEVSQLRRIGERVRTDAARRLERAAARLDQQATRHRLLDPRAVLARGFTFVRDEHGKVLPSSARLRPDQIVRVHFRDGHADSRITHVQQDTP